MTLVFLETACREVSVRMCAQCRAEAAELQREDSAGGPGGGGGAGEEEAEGEGAEVAKGGVGLGGGEVLKQERVQQRNGEGSDPSSLLPFASDATLAAPQQQPQQSAPAAAPAPAAEAPQQRPTPPPSEGQLGHFTPTLAAAGASTWGARSRAPFATPPGVESAAAAGDSLRKFTPTHSSGSSSGALGPQRTDAASAGLVSLDKSGDGCDNGEQPLGGAPGALSGHTGGGGGSGGGGEGGGRGGMSGGGGSGSGSGGGGGRGRSSSPPTSTSDFLAPQPSSAAPVQPPRRILNGGLAGFGSVGGGAAPPTPGSRVASMQRSARAPLEWGAGEQRSNEGIVLPVARAGRWEPALGGRWEHQHPGSQRNIAGGGVRYCRNCANPFFENLREPIQDALSAEASTCSRDCYSTLRMQGIY